MLAVCGDGGVLMGVGELATLVQERLPVTVLVVDDGGYGMLRYDQIRAGDHPIGTDLRHPDFAAVAAAFGMPATRVGAIGPELGRGARGGRAQRAAQPGPGAGRPDSATHDVPALARGLNRRACVLTGARRDPPQCDADHLGGLLYRDIS